MPPTPQNPLTLPAEKLSFGCPILDRLLAGGAPCGAVTELAGESAAGKTQLCLQLLLSAAAPRASGDLPAAALFISSEPPFPLRRLLSLSGNIAGGGAATLDHILVSTAFSSGDLLALLHHVDALLSVARSRRIRLLVLDSAAAIFRGDADDAARRSAELFAVSAKLKEQARRFNVAVVVTNHVVDVFDDGECRMGNYAELSSSGRRVCPAMGLAWANCVNVRLFLSRSAGGGGGEGEGGGGRVRRKIQVVFAPHLPEASCEFVVARGGVFGVATQA